jgi:hypothetical protein
MGQKEIFAILHEYKLRFAERYDIQSLGVFGSVARNEERPGSDIDIVIRLGKPDLFLLAGIKDDLEAQLHSPVDLVTYRESMNPLLRERIDREAVYV